MNLDYTKRLPENIEKFLNKYYNTLDPIILNIFRRGYCQCMWHDQIIQDKTKCKVEDNKCYVFRNGCKIYVGSIIKPKETDLSWNNVIRQVNNQPLKEDLKLSSITMIKYDEQRA